MSRRATRAFLYTLTLAAVLRAIEVPMSATISPSVPEIDGSSLSAGLGLLAAGILVLRSRRRSG